MPDGERDRSSLGCPQTVLAPTLGSACHLSGAPQRSLFGSRPRLPCFLYVLVSLGLAMVIARGLDRPIATWSLETVEELGVLTAWV